MTRISIFCLFLYSANVVSQVTEFAKDSINLASIGFVVYSDGNINEIDEASSGSSLVHTHSLVFRGFNENLEGLLTAQLYRLDGIDFQPGPVSDDPDAADNYNAVWKVSSRTIEDFVNGKIQSVPQSFRDWPAHGDTLLGEARNLAPFVDVNNNDIYDPHNGDYPCIKGAEAIFFMFNDAGATDGFGFEIHGMAYVQDGPGTLKDSTFFVEYEIYNRSRENYADVRMGIFTDIDLGDSKDDLSGTEIAENAVYAYNGNRYDSDFGYNLASAAMIIVEGPAADYFDGMDNDKDGCIDAVISPDGNSCLPESPTERIREHWMLDNSISIPDYTFAKDHFWHYLNNSCHSGLPKQRGEGYGLLNTNNGPMYCNFSGRPLTNFMFTGNSYDPSGTYDINTDLNWFESPLAKADKRIVASTGSFSVRNINDIVPITMKIAYVWHKADSLESSRDHGLGSLLDKIRRVNNGYDRNGGSCRSFFINTSENPVKDLFTVRYNFQSELIILENQTFEKIDCTFYNSMGQKTMDISMDPGSERSFDFDSFGPGLHLLLNKKDKKLHKVYIPQ